MAAFFGWTCEICFTISESVVAFPSGVSDAWLSSILRSGDICFFHCFSLRLLEYDIMGRALCGMVVVTVMVMVMVLVLESGILRRVIVSDLIPAFGGFLLAPGKKCPKIGIKET